MISANQFGVIELILCKYKPNIHVFCSRNYRQTSNIRRTSIGNTIVNHSVVVGAPPVGAAPTTFSFSPGFDWLGKDNCMTRRETFKFWYLMRPILEVWRFACTVRRRQNACSVTGLQARLRWHSGWHWWWVRLRNLYPKAATFCMYTEEAKII